MGEGKACVVRRPCKNIPVLFLPLSLIPNENGCLQPETDYASRTICCSPTYASPVSYYLISLIPI